MENTTTPVQRDSAAKSYKGTQKGFAPRPSTQILREISEIETMELHPAPGLTIGIICNVGFDVNEEGQPLKTPEMLNITEYQDYGGGYEVTKLPAGSMNMEDKNIFAGGDRELFSETGYVTKNGWKFARAVETTSTKTGERHIKVFLVTTNPQLMGAPTEKCIIAVTRTPIPEIHTCMTYDQRIGLRPAVEIMKYSSVGFAYALMNHIPVDWVCKNIKD
jgi:hypothetical protein